MMNRLFYFLVLLVSTSVGTHAQTVQWASSVLEFSSELSPVEFSAEQVLGKPNVYPEGGQNPNAWLPKNANDKEYIKLAYSTPMQVEQIAIAESAAPSAITEILLFDEKDNAHKVFVLRPKKIDEKRRLLNVFIDKTSYKVTAIQIKLDGSAFKGWSSIDAVAIADTKAPILIEVHLEDGINGDVFSDRMSDNVNSDYEEVKPIISPSGNDIFFSRKNHPDNIGGVEDDEDIWVSHRKDKDSEWQEAVNIGAPLNTKESDFISSVTPDGKSLIVLAGRNKKEKGKDGMQKLEVSMTTKTSEGWKESIPLNIKNNYNLADEADYYLANNRKILLISAKRKESYGMRDIYVSFRDSKGNWSEPSSLGDKINTASDEVGPFLAADDKTMYFSSFGYAGYGKRDIFVTRRLDDTWRNWSEPQNMGPGINSSENDSFFSISADGKDAYFARNEKGKSSDIFHISIDELYRPANVVKVYGKVLNKTTKEPMSASIKYEQLPEGKEIGLVEADPQTGEYVILLPVGHDYGYLAKADGYLAENSSVKLGAITDYMEIKQDLFLVPIKKDESIVLQNIFFEIGKSTLKDSSYPELDRLIKIFYDNPKLKVEISGHTDSSGRAVQNKKLSKERADAVKNYMILNGVNSKRIVTLGYGSEKPLVDSDKMEDMSKNRRVEFKILSD